MGPRQTWTEAASPERRAGLACCEGTVSGTLHGAASAVGFLQLGQGRDPARPLCSVTEHFRDRSREAHSPSPAVPLIPKVGAFSPPCFSVPTHGNDR